MRGLEVGGHGEGVEGMRGGWKLGEVWEKGGSRAKVWKRGKGFSKRSFWSRSRIEVGSSRKNIRYKKSQVVLSKLFINLDKQ